MFRRFCPVLWRHSLPEGAFFFRFSFFLYRFLFLKKFVEAKVNLILSQWEIPSGSIGFCSRSWRFCVYSSSNLSGQRPGEFLPGVLCECVARLVGAVACSATGASGVAVAFSSLFARVPGWTPFYWGTATSCAFGVW